MERFIHADADQILPSSRHKTEGSMEDVYSFIEANGNLLQARMDTTGTFMLVCKDELSHMKELMQVWNSCSLGHSLPMVDGNEEARRDGKRWGDMHHRAIALQVAAAGPKLLRIQCANCCIPKKDAQPRKGEGKCSGCTICPWYCCQECQKTHWPEHKAECRANPRSGSSSKKK
jgi:hypothetical protein